jgi:outer membrane protein assembly factor BamB
MAATAAGLLGLAVPRAVAGGADGWQQYAHDASRTNYNAGESQLSPGAVKHLKRKYKLPDVVTVAVQGKTLYAAQAGGIYEFNVATGHKGKHLKIGTQSFEGPGQPLLDGKKLVTTIGSDLVAVKLPKGKRAWTVKEPSNGAVSHLWSSVIISKGIVYGILSTNNSSLSTTTYKLMAISESTGKVVWSKKDYIGPLAASGSAVFAQANGDVEGPGAYDHTITALNAKTGVPLWAHPTQFGKIQIISDIVVTPAAIVVTCGGSIYGDDIYGLSPATGAIGWGYKDTRNNIAPAGNYVVTDGSTLTYVSSQGDIVGLNLLTGHKLWIKKVGNYPAIGADGVVYGYLDNGKVRAVRMSDGSTLWTGPQSFLYPTAVAHGRLLLTAQGGPGLAAYGKK